LGACGSLGLASIYPARVANRAKLARALGRHLAAKTTAEWQAAMKARDIISGPIAEYDAVIASAQLEHNGVIVEREHPTAGKVKYLKYRAP